MKRRKFLNQTAGSLALLMLPTSRSALSDSQQRPGDPKRRPAPGNNREIEQRDSDALITVFLCGDVMTGRAIDQILPYPGDPEIFESYLKDARMYVELAERTTGPIAKPVSFDYIWGDALAAFERFSPDLRIINLETSITRSNDVWRGKGINYRMNPRNIPCLTAAGIDGCTLANNHVLDWGFAGLEETLTTLKQANLKFAGAGREVEQARAPAVFTLPGKGRVLLFSYGHISSGVPYNWQATETQAGINVLYDLSVDTLNQIRKQIEPIRRDNDIVIASIHWGSNWGYRIPTDQKRFARGLIDQAGVDIVHGHSSHHPKGIEIYHNRPIIYGCGDFLNDYEGISGHEEYRGDLGLMYFITIDARSGELTRFELVPTQIRNFRVNRASAGDAQWLADMLDWQGRELQTRVQMNADGVLQLSSA